MSRHPGTRLTLFPLFGLLVVAPCKRLSGTLSICSSNQLKSDMAKGAEPAARMMSGRLSRAKPHRRELAGGQRHTYRIRLAADQFLKAVIEQDGIDVVARLLGPDGEQIMEFDSERRLRAGNGGASG